MWPITVIGGNEGIIIECANFCFWVLGLVKVLDEVEGSIVQTSNFGQGNSQLETSFRGSFTPSNSSSKIAR